MVVLTATDVVTQPTGKRKTSLLKNARKLLMKNYENSLKSLKDVTSQLTQTVGSVERQLYAMAAGQEYTLPTEIRSVITSCHTDASRMQVATRSLDSKLESLKTNESLTSPNTSTVD